MEVTKIVFGGDENEMRENFQEFVQLKQESQVKQKAKRNLQLIRISHRKDNHGWKKRKFCGDRVVTAIYYVTL